MKNVKECNHHLLLFYKFSRIFSGMEKIHQTSGLITKVGLNDRTANCWYINHFVILCTIKFEPNFLRSFVYLRRILSSSEIPCSAAVGFCVISTISAFLGLTILGIVMTRLAGKRAPHFGDIMGQVRPGSQKFSTRPVLMSLH